MSRESLEWLNNNTLIGLTGQRGNAWHRDLSLIVGGLDNHYEGAIPEADILSRLFNWTADERAVYIDGGENGLILDASRKAIVRSDNNAILGMHTDKYQIHNYAEWLIKHLSALVGGDAVFANAGLLKNGAVAWVQIEMPNNVECPGGVVIRPSILAATSLDGSLASIYKPVETNVVCDNTLDMGLGEAIAAYRRKHTRNSEFVLRDAAEVINTLHMIAEGSVKRVASLLNVSVTDGDWAKFVEAHAPIKDDSAKTGVTLVENKRRDLTQLWNADVRVAPWAGTAWGVVQAVNTYNEHMATVRGAVREERKMLRALKGDVAKADNAALITLGTVLGRDLINA